jgi:catechol 2,3-dioxygenase-like lactoylglutathione lyase family enzyme
MSGRVAVPASRRAVPALAFTLFLATALFVAAAPRAQGAATSTSPATGVRALAVGPIGLTVADLDRSVEWYTRVLHFTLESTVEVAGDPYEHLTGVFGARLRIARLRLGEERIELTEYLAPRGRPVPFDFRGNDRFFQHVAIITRDMDAAYLWLRENHVTHASTGPQRLPDWNPNAGGIQAVYFRDPDGHFLEILQFPPGKGDPRWQQPAGDLFLGIDHTAIVVGDTEQSLAFYRDVLGMRVVGTSENYGTEQEHLNNVFGARLRITALRAQSGPGIEFLEYLAPRDGRPFPGDERANDLVHWETTVVTSDAAQAYGALRQSGARLVSSGPITLPDGSLGFRKGVLVRDPDGHVMEVVEQ